VICTLLGILSGWYSLMRRFPDRPEEQAVLKLSRQSGSMGLGVSMRGILSLSSCTWGLRVGMNRLFGPLHHNFLIPWEQIDVTRKDGFWGPRVKLRFADSSIGGLTIPDYAANKLWRSIPERWPEAGPVPGVETRSRSIAIVSRQWLVATILASTFFLVVPRLVAPSEAQIPMAVAILFPAILLGLFSMIEYSRRR